MCTVVLGDDSEGVKALAFCRHESQSLDLGGCDIPALRKQRWGILRASWRVWHVPRSTRDSVSIYKVEKIGRIQLSNHWPHIYMHTYACVPMHICVYMYVNIHTQRKRICPVSPLPKFKSCWRDHNFGA